MVVLSGSGGEDDVRQPAPRPHLDHTLDLSELPPPRPETEDETHERTSFQTEDESERSRDDDDDQHPLDALGGLPHSPATVKKPTLASSARSDNILPDALSPLRRHDATESTLPSIELGRNSSPRRSPHASFDQHHHAATPSRALSKSPSPALTPHNAKLDSPLAPHDLNASAAHDNPVTPSVDQSAAQRRASHLLMTLRSTAKPRFNVRATPHPHRSAAKVASRLTPGGDDDDQHTASSFGSDRSSNDLTTFHKANTSLPVGSGGEALASGGSTGAAGGLGGGAAGGSRFNGAKLNAYLHTLNSHLTDENATLVKAVQRTARDNERLLEDKRRLEDTLREMSVLGPGTGGDASRSRAGAASRSSGGEDGESDGASGETSRVEMLGNELEGLVAGQRRIRGLQDQLGVAADGTSITAAQRIAELEAELDRAHAVVGDKDAEVRRLRDRVVDEPSGGGDDSDASTRLSGLQREVFELKDSLGAAEADRDVLRADLAKLQRDFASAGEASAAEVAALQDDRDALLVALEDKDRDLDAARRQLEEQETEFADNNAQLEKELCAVMEAQEAKVERVRDEVEQRRRDDEQVRRAERDKLERVERERDDLERQLVAGAPDDAAAKDLERKVHALRDEVAQLEETVAGLRGDVEARDDELARMQEELELAERRVDELERGEGGGGDVDVDELRQQVAQKDDELRQLEDALDDSAQQLVDNETVLADKEAALESLRAQLDAEQAKTTALEARLSQLSVPKAKSPLANEVFSAAQDDVISSLEEELDAARRECDDLRKQLAAATHEDESARLRELEVQQLESDKANLEDRVKSLRQQVSVQLSSPAGTKTPDKSWFRPLPSFYTPKTPGQLFGNLSAFSPGTTANETISPLLAQIHELEQVVEHLQSQLSDANVQIDTKLDKLEAAGSGTISLARQLSTAQSRIAQLEGDLERLLGDGGSLERVRGRLAKVHCPECQATFDANKTVQLRIDRDGVSFAEPSSSSSATPKADSLKTTLASVNAKLAELRTENDVLQQQASRSKDLAADKAKLSKQHDAVQRELKQAKGDIAVLETDLRTERSRLRNLASEQLGAGKAKAALEARLASAESELAAVKRELAKAVAADVVERLRKEKDSLVAERADLIRQLADVNERASRADTDLSSTKADHAALQAQLARQAADLDALRASLSTKEAEQRALQDERGDILRGVANLQADLNRVRQDAISLGLDLAAVRRERDELGAKKSSSDEVELGRAREELSVARRKLGALEEELARHVCSPTSTTSTALAQLQTKHKSEVKGLLVLLRQLKLRVEREMDFRVQAGSQKRYLEGVVRTKQETIDTILTQLSLPVLSSPPTKPTSLRSVALAVVASQRMQRMSSAWKEQSAPKKRLRDQLYQDVRGKPFPG
ncbi:uncharacterized protein RHOBADRAFT_43963 [Rhodotorula graminis WP1]|uniref:Pericentrin/AKAP-450 centrosomal targeting domain-containing protein n=1 Tax=Rhodotorula graminis (strain WP1) TaxID=578459 RepID=A0A194S3Z7_RHOGW|nr:uncharacterized protein RHOBADRAFT_43963 [Rhodotorula graminis WP1]KPV75458.1 hypothetical protein RHOBADRAFT_43963 [Rhodotorula graminis WP1]